MSLDSDLWREALRSALPIVSAYLTPSTLNLSRISLGALSTDGLSLFQRAVLDRAQLAFASEVNELMRGIDPHITTRYRHRTKYSVGTLAGKLHVPKYLRLKARGSPLLPSIRIAQEFATPENVLASECLSIAVNVTRHWINRAINHAEEGYALRLLSQLTLLERTQPWSSLRFEPRGSVRSLAQAVIAQHKAGALYLDNPFVKLATKVLGFNISQRAIEDALEDFVTLLSMDPSFEDRIFELLCLAWIIRALETLGFTMSTSRELQGPARVKPLITAVSTFVSVELFFQSSTPLPESTWRDAISGSALRALPDIVLRRLCDGEEMLFIIDAKNRSASAKSEVLYKLLGYKENLALDPYYAAAFFPEGHLSLSRYKRGPSRILLCQTDLTKGERLLKRIAQKVL